MEPRWRYAGILILVFIFTTGFTAAAENERLPGIPDSFEYSPADAIDLNYIQIQVLEIGEGVYTSSILHSAEDWEKEASAAEEKVCSGCSFPSGIALLANSKAISKYQSGDYTSGERNAALTRCYLRSADIYAQSPIQDNKDFALDMYDKALEYNRFNYDAYNGKIKLLESQGSFVQAQVVRSEMQRARSDQEHLIYSASLLPLPGYIVILAVLFAGIFMSRRHQ